MPNPIPTQDLQKNSADLQELRDRVNFAESEIKALGNEVVSYRKNSVTLTRRPIPGRDAHDVYLAKSTELPVGIRVKIGNITNDLRACLDGLACVLAIRNGKDTKGVYFPISRDKNAFNADGMQKLRKLSSNDQDYTQTRPPHDVRLY